MIPIIISIEDKDNQEEIISQYALKEGIPPSHVMRVQPEKDELTVDQIHLFQKDIQVTFSKRVLVAFVGVDNSSGEVQNSLLKSLEEDSTRIQFLFLVKNSARLLPTILSRCSLIKSNVEKMKCGESQQYKDAFSFQNNTEVTKVIALEKIDAFLNTPPIHNCKILRHILTMRKLIMDNNMNPVLALDNILIFMSKTSTMRTVHEK